MEEIAISKFKATCLAVLEKVKKPGHQCWSLASVPSGCRDSPARWVADDPPLRLAHPQGVILGNIV
jgi:hypothetical protein